MSWWITRVSRRESIGILLEEFRRRLDSLAEYCSRIGALADLDRARLERWSLRTQPVGSGLEHSPLGTG